VLVVGTAVAAGQTVSVPPDDPASVAAYRPITPRQRFNWFVDNTIGPGSLTVGVFSSAIGTGLDRPKEYGPHWAGFGKRYGMRLTGVSTSNAMEAGLGAIWGEDPRYRYYRAEGEPTKDRIEHVAIMTMLSRNREGHLMPAYVRYMAIPGSNFLSNTWRADSEANTGDALLRTGFGFISLMSKNAFSEFWPDIRRRVFHGSKYVPATLPGTN